MDELNEIKQQISIQQSNEEKLKDMLMRYTEEKALLEAENKQLQ